MINWQMIGFDYTENGWNAAVSGIVDKSGDNLWITGDGMDVSHPCPCG